MGWPGCRPPYGPREQDFERRTGHVLPPQASPVNTHRAWHPARAREDHHGVYIMASTWFSFIIKEITDKVSWSQAYPIAPFVVCACFIGSAPLKKCCDFLSPVKHTCCPLPCFLRDFPPFHITMILFSGMQRTWKDIKTLAPVYKVSPGWATRKLSCHQVRIQCIFVQDSLSNKGSRTNYSSHRIFNTWNFFGNLKNMLSQKTLRNVFSMPECQSH